MARKNVKLSVGRGEKKSVKSGAGLTAKGRAKHNRATGSNLKAPTKDPKNPRHKSSVLEVKAGKVSVVRRLVGAGVVVKQKALVYPQMISAIMCQLRPRRSINFSAGFTPDIAKVIIL